MRDNVQGMHDAHRDAAPAGIATEEGDKPDRLSVLFSDQGFVERIYPKAVLAKSLSRRPWSLSWEMVVDEARDEGKEEIRVIGRG
jgi:hypothetical protein